MTHLWLSCPKQSAAYEILTEVLPCVLNGYLVSNKDTTVFLPRLKYLCFSVVLVIAWNKLNIVIDFPSGRTSACRIISFSTRLFSLTSIVLLGITPVRLWIRTVNNISLLLVVFSGSTRPQRSSGCGWSSWSSCKYHFLWPFNVILNGIMVSFY